MKILTSPLVRLAVVCLMPTLAQAGPGRIVTGADSGAGAHVKAFNARTQTNVASFFAYPTFNGGVRVAAGDVNGDGAPDIITGTGPGAAHVKVFSGRDGSEIRSFLAYGAAYAGGVFVAAGDVNGDGLDDIITGTEAGVSGHVKVFDGQTGTELHSFFAYSAGFSGGVRVAVGDVNGDGRADIITGTGPGSAGHVKVFDGVSLAELKSFFAYGVSFTGGVYVAAGDINGDGRCDLVTGAASGPGGHVKVFDGQTGTELHSFFAYSAGFSGGVRVAAGDLNGDGRNEILTLNGPGAAGQVKVFDGITGSETSGFNTYPETFTGGAFLGVASLKGPRLEIHTTRTPNEIQLQWPSGCLCELEGNSDPINPRGWETLDVKPVENGARIGLLLPAVQKYQSYRLKCDADVTR